jgi:putative transposase
MKHRFVAAERASYPVRLVCRVIGAAAGGFHAWLRRGPSRRACLDRDLAGRIATICRKRVARTSQARAWARGQGSPPLPAHDQQPT